ncbi:Adhesin biosynthesis transcription regulatory protein [Shewanella psychrophila]|uniref:Adhesin biosynthesis transcription regulatory protein n=1 Tax=Shewanella psychrophila TaxID=225848 RepID=A0A1S6HXK2_9GAMM|nr:PapB/FocB family fimbrial expression transcriptional regulator [Shewanella psychrophila]AQS40231.1 Adhesin biosynthesis transcription regulatory protein [Shewanella psychrophila]
MNYLLPGGEQLKRLQLLLKLTKITSEQQINALTEHYVNGLSAERAAARFQIEKSNLSRAQTRLEEVTSIVEQIKELDWSQLNAVPISNQQSSQLTDADNKRDGVKQ